jgi:endonuclease/exonuclease/phosphatase family metal-dependent hydrolase
MHLRVLTYNIHKGFSVGNRRFVLGQMRERIAETGADLVLLQEVLGQHDHHAGRVADWPDRPQWEFLADSAWPHHAYGRNALYAHGHHGNAILSKRPFAEWENIDISTNGLIRRGLLHGVIARDHGPPLHVICLHLDLHGGGRAQQVAMICARVAQTVPADAPLIIAGDLNDWGGGAGREIERGLGAIEAFKHLHGRHARSFPTWLPLLQLDRIYVRGLRPKTAECLTGAGWRSLSDHGALLAEFEL